jgi:uncharacterized protein YxjI
VSALLSGRAGIGLHQRRKFFEMRNQYDLTDETGSVVGTVEQIEQSKLQFAARLISDLDIALPVKLAVNDASGNRVMTLHKPWFKYAVSVTGPNGEPLGHVNKQIRFGKAQFSVLGAGGEPLGQVVAESWRARDFRIDDAGGIEVARVTKEWRGLATEMFTDADSYAVTFPPSTGDHLRDLALAAALSVDITMKQKDY